MKQFKQWRKIIVFGAVLVLLIGALVVNSLLNREPENGDKPTPTPGPDPVTDIAEEDVETITIENDKGELIIAAHLEDVSSGSGESSSEARKEVVWKLEDPVNVPFSQATIKGKVSGFLNISVSSEVTNDISKASEYGLDDPSAKVTVKLRSGDKIVLLFGNEVAGGGSHYIMAEGTGRICTVSSYKAEDAFIGYLDLIDKNILGGITQETADSMIFKRDKDDLYLQAEAETDPDSGENPVRIWSILLPIEAEASSEGFFSFIAEVMALSPSEFKELHPEDLSIFGLDKPSYEFELKSGSLDVRLLLGGDAGGGMIYGYSDFTDAVFTIDMKALAYIDKPAVELMSTFVYIVSVWEVSEIDIRIGQETINCELDDSQDKDIPSDFRVNGQDANVEDSSGSSYFRKFYQSVISIFIEGLDLEAEPEYKEDITVIYTLKEGGEKVKLAFSRRDEFSYYCFRDGEYQGYYVSRDDFFSEKSGDEGILPSYDILKNAMDKQVDGVYQ